MSSVDWCGVYERLAIRLKKNLQDSVSKTSNIHKKYNFPLRIYLINVSKPQFYADMFTFTKYIFHKKFIFCALICAINRQKIVKKEITYFLKNYFSSLFTFFEKVFAICKFFTARCLDARYWDLLYFILKFSPQDWCFLLCWFSRYF